MLMLLYHLKSVFKFSLTYHQTYSVYYINTAAIYTTNSSYCVTYYFEDDLLSIEITYIRCIRIHVTVTYK